MLKTFLSLLFLQPTKFLYLSFFCFASAIGINLVTFPTLLKSNKINPSQIGLAFGVEILGVAIMSFFLSKLAGKIGIIKSIKYAAIIYSSIILISFFYYNYFWWLFLVFILGCCWLVMAITRISWLNNMVSTEDRGVALGIFSALISLGVAFGPVLVKIFGASSYWSFLTSATLVLMAFLSIIPLKKHLDFHINSQRISLKEFYKKNPNNFWSRFFLDFTTYVIVSLSVVFGISIGLSPELSGLFITAYMASGFFDIIVGFILKKVSTKKLINIGFLGCLYCFLLVSLYQKSYPFLILLFFIFGLFIACIYVSVFKMMNDDYSAQELVSANATFQLVGTCGSIFGTIIGGLMIEYFGAQGFPIIICFGALFYLTFFVIYEKTKKYN
ncbi:MAG: MFS transporter [Rickettsiales bacterium]